MNASPGNVRSRLLLGVLAAASLALAGCGGAEAPKPEEPAPSVTPRGRVLIVGLDGADWKILDRLGAAGKLPNLTRLRREGASGVLRSEAPLLSPIVWTTIATGRRPLDHGIVGFLTVRQGKTEPVRSDERKVRAFWNVATDLGVEVGVVGWYASWPAEPVDGFLVSDRVGTHQIAGSEGAATAGLAYPDRIVPEILEARDAIDREIGPRQAAMFFEASKPGGAVVRIDTEKLDTFVGILRTTELYRRIFPKLRREFDPTISAVYFEGTDAVGHLFAEYVAPPLPGVDPALAAHLAPAWDRYYAWIDSILGEFLAGVDPATTTVMVVSDHGFKTGTDRPSTPSKTSYANLAPEWHRPEGVILLWGRGVRAGTRIPEASIYDVVPTAFRLVGLPLARTLPGRPLDAALTPEIESTPATTVADYEAAGPRETALAEDTSSPEVLEKLKALGYVGGASGSESGPGEGQEAVPLNRYNRGMVLLRAGKADDALREFRSLQRDDPEFALGYLGEGTVLLGRREAGSAVAPLQRAAELAPHSAEIGTTLAEAYGRVGRVADAERELERVLASSPDKGKAALMLGEIRLARRELVRARALLETARTGAPTPLGRATACVDLAVIAEESKDLDRAAAYYGEALGLVPAMPRALERFANLELYRGNTERGLSLLERLATVLPDNARAQALYGRALARAGRPADARRALERSIRLDPAQPEVRRMLDDLSRSGAS